MSDADKAKKLAAAKKKLKQYNKQKCKQSNVSETLEGNNYPNEFIHESQCDSEKSEESVKEAPTMQNSQANSPSANQPDFQNGQSKRSDLHNDFNGSESNIHMDAIEMLIAEKSSLSTQVTKLQTSCKEKDLEIEELNTMLESAKRRIESLEKTSVNQNAEISSLRSNLEEMQLKLGAQENECNKYKRQVEDQVDYSNELKRELTLSRNKNEEIEAELKEKTCQLELYKIRINQISEEASVATDSRVEDLTQIRFTHEQQIRDLEVIIKLLNSEKEQASQQYQNYVQHLNKEVSSLSEKNLELLNERSKLIDREKTMVDHIAQLEKQIQENLARQGNLKTHENEQAISDLTKENLILKEKISDLEKQCEEVMSTIRIQEEKIAKYNFEIREKESKIEELEEKIQNFHSDTPDNAKLLAAIESDKIAASRAVAQNEELKKQLEEIQLKLIQVTNEKVELVELLQSEQHMNREIRSNYENINENLKQTTEKLHYKDEEMIRLTHENNELNKKILKLNQQVDRLMHYEANEHILKYVDKMEANNNNTRHVHSHSEDENDCSHEHSEHEHEHEHECSHKHERDNDSTVESAVDALHSEEKYTNSVAENICSGKHSKISNDLPVTEAMHKLQDRFKTLMCEVADLTDEKQRLEHLVLQLQGETETIGEYIALYQTQRRVLKQREIEKNAQLHRFLTERQEMKEKIIELTQLIKNLEAKPEHLKNDAIQEKIHSIISEIKEKDIGEEKPAGVVDHCACCSGKFETI